MSTFLRIFENRFSQLHERSCALVRSVKSDDLYRQPRVLPKTFAMFSVGEYILRSAASAEQVFGGITTRLWDDPFEWTLPEKLNTPAAVLDYLSEVEQISRKGFAFFENDEDLLRKIAAPVQLKSVFEILLSTIARAEHFQGRAFAVFQMISDEKLPRM